MAIKRKSPLYDNPGPKAKDKEAAATAEADMEMGDTPKADSKAETGADKAVAKVESAGEKFSKAISEIRKRHESERKDFHGNHREAIRQMAARHDKEISALLDQIGTGNANDMDGGTSAPGGMAVVDGVEGEA